MRYFYERPKTYRVTKGATYTCDAELYSKCTLYKDGELGLAVVQERFNSKLKIFWWGPIDPWLVDEIYNNPQFQSYFSEHAKQSQKGVYPTVTVRSCMYRLRMKPLKKQSWELARITPSIIEI